MPNKPSKLLLLLLILSVLAVPASYSAGTVSFTILHTNDFHGQLQASGSNPGLARVAAVVNGVRSSVGAGNVLLADAGDGMQGSMLSNLQKGVPTIAAFNKMGYNVSTLGNHEFDWGQSILTDRAAQATFPFIAANIVVNDTGSCATAGWTAPAFTKPYEIRSVAGINVAFIGVSTTETPIITTASATQGLCFKDPADSIVHYYDTVKAGADVIVVLSHIGFTDGGYGYGIPVYGDQTLAEKLYQAGKPVPLIIGGHSHTNVSIPAPVIHGVTTIAQAYYNGRQVGRADLTFDPATKAVTVAWQKLTVSTTGPEDPDVKSVIDAYATDPSYLSLVNQPIGYSAVDLARKGGTVDNMMAAFVDDAIYNYLNTDTDPGNDVDIFFNNAGGIRTDWCWNGTAWMSSGCASGTHDPALLTYGNMFMILPFGNATVVGQMTGAQILQVLNQAPMVSNGVIQPAGLKYKYYGYKDSEPQPYAWGAFDYCVVNKATHACDPLDMAKTYSVGTNEFLAPAGGDGYAAFKYMTNITYWGDMLNAVDAYVSAHHGSPAAAYRGPNGDGTLDDRIIRDGGDALDSGTIRPITILHHNDSHGSLAKGTYVGYTQLASLIKQERAHNPTRTLLLNAGDQIQGDAMMYYFKTAPTGFAADGTPLPDALKTHPMMAVMNALDYDAMVLGNHEFNFGADVFKGILAQSQFPILGANVADNGSYGLSVANGGAGVLPYIEKDLGGIKVAVLGITNHRVPNFELPSNIVGLTFGNPLTVAQQYATQLKAQDDVVVALTHIGFTTNPKSVEVDANVDTAMAAQVHGLDAIIGGHSHSNPASPEAPYKFLPTIVESPNDTPVLVNQAYRYNNSLGEVVLGVRPKTGGGYEVVSATGQYFSVNSFTPEDAATKAIVDPYVAQLNAYNNKVVGKTTEPIDTLNGFTEETNGATLQADSSVWELAQHGITDVDVHLAGAMTNKLMASGATVAAPVSLKISDMFAGMPYEDSLVVIKMNGPQLKAVLERAYRNYYYYKYVPGYGGYAYYTMCTPVPNSVARVYYKDTSPALPDGNNVVALLINGNPVNFTDSSKYYNISTISDLAAGNCNFNDGGVSLWPLNQIVHDTQYYVRDAAIDYITAKGTISPKVEGRLLYGDTVAPIVSINVPAATNYMHSDSMTFSFSAVDGAGGTTPGFAPPSRVKSLVATLDGTAISNGQTMELYNLSVGSHTVLVIATDYYGNSATQTVTFQVIDSFQSLIALVNKFYTEGKISKKDLKDNLLQQLNAAKASFDSGKTKTAKNQLLSFINAVLAQRGKAITAQAADILIADANYIINHM